MDVENNYLPLLHAEGKEPATKPMDMASIAVMIAPIVNAIEVIPNATCRQKFRAF